ncbi:MAG: hypothetical protein M3332_03440, partial [Actinomycetota bacterium]|nr:hypothetical protein [Actinomycetota bacterium]
PAAARIPGPSKFGHLAADPDPTLRATSGRARSWPGRTADTGPGERQPKTARGITKTDAAHARSHEERRRQRPGDSVPSQVPGIVLRRLAAIKAAVRRCAMASGQP